MIEVNSCARISCFGRLTIIAPLMLIGIISAAPIAHAQKKKSTVKKPQNKQTLAKSPLELLHDEYIKSTKDLKAILERSLPYHEKPQKSAEEKLLRSKELFSQGLISKRELENDERAVVEARAKVEEVRKQIRDADTQVAQALIEVQAEKEIAKLPKGSLVRSTSLIRYNGAGPWALSQVGKIDTFFRLKFGRPLPIAVFGQGPIHNQWRLDHRNAMDVSVNPNGPEAQALMDFLRANGIPFSAFRTAIPGVATGPHFHIGLPSHRY